MIETKIQYSIIKNTWWKHSEDLDFPPLPSFVVLDVFTSASQKKKKNVFTSWQMSSKENAELDVFIFGPQKKKNAELDQ